MDTTISRIGSEITANQSGVLYQWLDCGSGMIPIPGATLQTFTPTKNGSYAVILADSLCSDTSVCYMVNDVGLNENDFSSDIGIYPNPTTGLISVVFNEVSEDFSLTITNIIGETIIKGDWKKTQNMELEIDGAPGIYILNVKTTSGKTAVKKVVKQ